MLQHKLHTLRTLIVGGGYNKEGGLAIQLNFVVWGGHNKLKWGGVREKYIKWGGRMHHFSFDI